MTPPQSPNSINRRGFMGYSALAAGALAISALPACSSWANHEPRVGLALFTYNVPRWVLLDVPNFTKAAARDGFQTVSQQADSKVDKQLNDVLNLLAQGAKSMAIAPVSGAAGVNLVRQCRENGVPVLAYNNLIPSPDIAGYVARDSRAVGLSQVEHAARFFNGLRGNVVIASGTAGDPVAIGVTKGVLEGLQPLVDSGAVTIVSQEYHSNWDAELARQQTEDALTRTRNDLSAVFANNDGLAGGALNALRAQKLNGKAFVAGMDATSDACRAIVTGDQQMTMFTEFDVMASTAGHLAAQLALGQTIDTPDRFQLDSGEYVKWFKAPSYAITIDNLVDYVAKYSENGYVDPQRIFGGIPPQQLPPGASQLLQK